MMRVHVMILHCLLCCALLLGHPAFAQAVCSSRSLLQFKPATVPYGLRSFVTYPGQQLNYTASFAVPSIIVQIIGLNSNNASLGLDFSLDGSTVIASITPSLRVGGNAAQVNRGEAIFTALTIQQNPNPSDNPTMTFSLVTPAGQTLSVMTGTLVAFPTSVRNTPASVRFSNAGYFTRDGQTRDVPLSVALPEFGLEIVNPTGEVISITSSIAVAAVGATVSQRVLNSLTVTNLVVTAAPANFSLTFTASASIGTTGQLWTSSTSTGALRPVTIPQRSRFMLFDQTVGSSFLSRENQGGDAVLGVPLPPITISIFTSDMTLDTATTGLLITASCTQAQLTGAQAMVVRGNATFTDLAFAGAAPTAAVIVFTAGPQGNYPVAGSQLSSGAMSVSLSPVKAKYLTFGPSSSISATVPAHFAVTSQTFVVPQIVVQLRDSAYQIDNSANNIQLKLGASPSSAIFVEDASVLATTVTNGIAVFNNLLFTSLSSPLRFTVSDPSSTSADQRAMLTSAEVFATVNALAAAASVDKVTLANSMLLDCLPQTAPNCAFKLRFASSYGAFSSSVFAADQSTFITSGTTIPTIVIEFRDQFGVSTALPATSAPDMVAYTTDPDSELYLVTDNDANYGTWQNGRFYFSCLRFRKVPPALVRLNFMAVDRSSVPATRYFGIPVLRTGVVIVTPSLTPNFGLRFSTTSDSYFLYEGQTGSAVLNVALPPVTVVLVNSDWQFDSSDSSTFVVVSTSSGTLNDDGTREAVVNGKATFNNIQFSSVSDSPRLTFTVTSRSASTVHAVGRSITTGYLMVTSLPINDFELDVSHTISANNLGSHQFQQLVFGNLTDASVQVSIIVRNSAHETTANVRNEIVITPSSEQATLDNIQSKRIDSGVACACANFTNVITGYKTGYAPGTPIFIVYTATTAQGLLLGKSVTVGPIAVNELDRTAVSCATNLVSPGVIGEFRVDPATFARSNIRSSLAFLLGIPAKRVTIPAATIVPIRRVDYTTLSVWSGTKATIFFADPAPGTATATDLTGAQAAASFVQLRPGCDAVALNLESVYYAADVQVCDVTQFKLAVQSSAACATSGILSLCQCYAQGVIAQWGIACSEEPSLANDFSNLCFNTLKQCAEAGVQSLCGTVLNTDSGTDVVQILLIVLGSIGGVALLVVVLTKTGIIRAPTKTSLKRTADTA